MRAFLAALTLAGAVPSATATAGGPTVHLVQMSRDVTDAVRRQRAERPVRSHRDICARGSQPGASWFKSCQMLPDVRVENTMELLDRQRGI
jgi:hypothetical protein